jgi:phage gpG-like protein
VAGFKVTFTEFAGLDQARAALGKLKAFGADLTPFMQDARTILIASTLERFATGKGPGGIPWKPSKRAQGLVKDKAAGRTLVDTGDLQSSIKGVTGPDFVEVGSDGLKNPIKAVANQFGSRRQTVVVRHTRTVTVAFGAPLASPTEQTVRAHGRVTNLPARPFIGVDDQDVADIREVWQERIVRTFGDAARA